MSLPELDNLVRIGQLKAQRGNPSPWGSWIATACGLVMTVGWRNPGASGFVGKSGAGRAGLSVNFSAAALSKASESPADDPRQDTHRCR